jgi:undecaprenyl-diphosphatase
MDIFQAIVLGIIQGFTEFLPISSSGHLVFVPVLFGWEDQGLPFDVVVHLGTLLAVVVYFRKKLTNIGKAMFGMEITDYSLPVTSYKRIGWFILLSIIPAGFVGFFISEVVEIGFRSTWIVGVSLIVWGFVLAAADGFNKGLKKHDAVHGLEKMGWKQVVFIACAQAIALIPGTSRSGITMSAGLFSKLDKKSAAEFSFLMSVPIIVIAGAVKIVDLFQIGLGAIGLLSLIVGFVASLVSGLVAIAGLMKIIEKWSFMPFVVYRIIVGVLILMFLV